MTPDRDNGTQIMDPEAETFQHRGGQVYESCNPHEVKHLVIDSIDRTAGTAKVSRPGAGGRDRNKRRRTIKLSALHPTGVTGAGVPRLSGWRLMCDRPQPGQEMCGVCFHYFDKADLPSGDCCQPCAVWLEERFSRPRE